jgi:hypothetical protein
LASSIRSQTNRPASYSAEPDPVGKLVPQPKALTRTVVTHRIRPSFRSWGVIAGVIITQPAAQRIEQHRKGDLRPVFHRPERPACPWSLSAGGQTNDHLPLRQRVSAAPLHRRTLLNPVQGAVQFRCAAGVQLDPIRMPPGTAQGKRSAWNSCNGWCRANELTRFCDTTLVRTTRPPGASTSSSGTGGPGRLGFTVGPGQSQSSKHHGLGQ